MKYLQRTRIHTTPGALDAGLFDLNRKHTLAVISFRIWLTQVPHSPVYDWCVERGNHFTDFFFFFFFPQKEYVTIDLKNVFKLQADIKMHWLSTLWFSYSCDLANVYSRGRRENQSR